MIHSNSVTKMLFEIWVSKGLKAFATDYDYCFVECLPINNLSVMCDCGTGWYGSMFLPMLRFELFALFVFGSVYIGI